MRVAVGVAVLLAAPEARADIGRTAGQIDVGSFASPAVSLAEDGEARSSEGVTPSPPPSPDAAEPGSDEASEEAGENPTRLFVLFLRGSAQGLVLEYPFSYHVQGAREGAAFDSQAVLDRSAFTFRPRIEIASMWGHRDRWAIGPRLGLAWTQTRFETEIATAIDRYSLEGRSIWTFADVGVELQFLRRRVFVSQAVGAAEQANRAEFRGGGFADSYSRTEEWPVARSSIGVRFPVEHRVAIGAIASLELMGIPLWESVPMGASLSLTVDVEAVEKER